MEAKPTQYAVVMEAHDQVVSELEAHRTGDCTGLGPFSQAHDDLRRATFPDQGTFSQAHDDLRRAIFPDQGTFSQEALAAAAVP